ncbi:hypothetical protein [Dysosmobacter sp.]
MEKMKKLLEVFGDYLSANTYYEIYWSRLHQQYFAMSVEDEPAVFFENYEDLRRYIVGEFLHDLMFSDDFYDDRKEKGVSYKVVMAFREKMKPYIEKLPELESVMEEVIEFEVNY